MKKNVEKVMPYGDDAGSKGGQVEEMFDSIAPAYDQMNTIMSLGMHTYWRNKALRMAAKLLGREPGRVLDVATGTGDVAFAMSHLWPEAEIIGIDLSEGMLSIAREKRDFMAEKRKINIDFRKGDSLALEYPDSQFDLVTVAYGVRNFENPLKGYQEMLRVLRPGGVICVVELSMPTAWLPLLFYKGYTRGLIPVAGRLMSGDPRAYSYLHESIEAAPQRGDMTALMKKAGFSNAEFKSVFPGAVTIYTGKK